MSGVIKFYIRSVGVLLLLSSVAKFISACGSSKILQKSDPILHFSFHHLFWIVGVLELLISAVCFFHKRIALQTGLTAWLATVFVFYRFGLLLVDYQKPCPCLGNLTDGLHISPVIADIAMKVVLVYILLGSYAILFSIWKKNRQSS